MFFESPSSVPSSLTECLSHAQSNFEHLQQEIEDLRSGKGRYTFRFKEILEQIFLAQYLISILTVLRHKEFRGCCQLEQQNKNRLDCEVEQLNNRINNSIVYINDKKRQNLIQWVRTIYPAYKSQIVFPGTETQAIEDEIQFIVQICQALAKVYDSCESLHNYLESDGSENASSTPVKQRSETVRVRNLLAKLEPCRESYKFLLLQFDLLTTDSSLEKIKTPEARPGTPPGHMLTGIANGDGVSPLRTPSNGSSPLFQRPRRPSRAQTSPPEKSRLAALKTDRPTLSAELAAFERQAEVAALEREYEAFVKMCKKQGREIDLLNNKVETLEVSKQELDRLYNTQVTNSHQLEKQLTINQLQYEERESTWKKHVGDLDNTIALLHQELKFFKASQQALKDELGTVSSEKTELIEQRDRYYDAIREYVSSSRLKAGQEPLEDDTTDYFEEFEKQKLLPVNKTNVLHAVTSANIEHTAYEIKELNKDIKKGLNQASNMARELRNSLEEYRLKAGVSKAQGYVTQMENINLGLTVDYLANRDAMQALINYTKRVFENLSYLPKSLLFNIFKNLESSLNSYIQNRGLDELAQELGETLNEINELFGSESPLLDQTAVRESKRFVKREIFNLSKLAKPLTYSQDQLKCTVTPQKGDKGVRLSFFAPRKAQKTKVVDECILWCMHLLIEAVEHEMEQPNRCCQGFRVKFGAAPGMSDYITRLQEYLVAYMELYDDYLQKDLGLVIEIEDEAKWKEFPKNEMDVIKNKILCQPPNFFNPCGQEAVVSDLKLSNTLGIKC